tara:strand:+ start:1336 stop:1557 length:222 start_codon:yes stop_codon:yes gene_type:complete
MNQMTKKDATMLSMEIARAVLTDYNRTANDGSARYKSTLKIILRRLDNTNLYLSDRDLKDLQDWLEAQKESEL